MILWWVMYICWDGPNFGQSSLVSGVSSEIK